MKSFIEKYSEIIVWVFIIIIPVAFLGCIFYFINNH
jgi:hypothetical protein